MSPSPRFDARVRRAGLPAVVLLLAMASGCTAGPTLTPTPTPTPTLTAALDEVVEAQLAERDPHDGVRAVLVLEDGDLIYDRYIGSGPDDYWDIRSVTKSFTATLVGIAIDQGLISDVDATLGELLPRWSAQLTAETSAIPLRAVLTHTANFVPENQTDASGVFMSADPVGEILATRARMGPGDGYFNYSGAGSHVLAAIVSEAAGMPVLAFARQYLLDPLGIVTRPALEPTIPFPSTPEEYELQAKAYHEAEFAWPVDVTGIHLGSGLMKLRPSDLAKLGQLYLDRGQWNGTQLVSESWVEQATMPQVEVPARRGHTDHYGFQWWVSSADHFFSAIGIGGTVVVVDPSRKLVVVVASEIGLDQSPIEAMLPGNARDLAKAILNEFEAEG